MTLARTPAAVDDAGRRLRMVVVIDRPRIGGAEAQTFAVMRALARRGVELELICYTAQDDALPDLPADIAVTHLGFSRMSDPKGWRATAEAVAARRPDVVLGVNALPIAVLGGARALYGLKAPIVAGYHGTGFVDAGERRRFLLVRAGLLFADTLVYVSANQRRHWRRRGVRARRDTVILNGVDPVRFAPPSPAARSAARAALGLEPDEVGVVLCARFRPEKNHGQLLEAVAALRARGRPFTALFVGDGPTRARTEAAAAALNLGAAARFLGEHRDVRPFLAAADVAVLVSTTIETFSIAALEAMAMGLPAVMSNIGGASEMVEDGRNGFLFPAGATAALIDGLARAADPVVRQRLGSVARARVEAEFTEGMMVEAYEALFRRAVGAKAR